MKFRKEALIGKGRKRREAERRANLRYQVVYTDLFDWDAPSFAVSDPLPYEEAVAVCAAEQEEQHPEFDRYSVVPVPEPRGPASDQGEDEPPRRRRKPRHAERGETRV